MSGRRTVMWAATRSKFGFDSFMHGPEVCSLFSLKKEDLVQVVVRDLKPGETSMFWAWWDAIKKEFVPGMVWPWEGGVEMCFAYGTKPEVEQGRGEKVNVFVQRTP